MSKTGKGYATLARKDSQSYVVHAKIKYFIDKINVEILDKNICSQTK
jgi:hypothetical protein